MTIKPIIFSGPMVRALLDGRKTQTRRVLKSDDRPDGLEPNGEVCHYYGDHRIGACLTGSTYVQRIPYAPGDLLWVREAHYLTNKHAYRLSVGVEQKINPADGYEACVYKEGFDRSTFGLRLRPSIHMPRWASRLTLRVTDVRVQRVQEINRGEAMEEGCPFPNMAKGPDPREWFSDLWDSLNADRGHGWDANPWVVALTFEVISQNVDEVSE